MDDQNVDLCFQMLLIAIFIIFLYKPFGIPFYGPLHWFLPEVTLWEYYRLKVGMNNKNSKRIF